MTEQTTCVPPSRPRARATFGTLGAVLLAVTLGGCGGANPAGPSEAAHQETVNGNVTAYGTTQHALTPPRSGQMRLLLNWANGAIDLDLYLTDSTCNTYPPLHCATLATSAGALGTSETINRRVTAGEPVKLWVDSFHFTLATDYTIQVTIE